MWISFCIFIEFILIALLMGYFIQYARTKASYIIFKERRDIYNYLIWEYKMKRYSNIWHGIGLIMRIGFSLITFFSFWGFWYHAILGTLISIVFSWTIFDRIINIIIGNSFWYVDGRRVNRFLAKVYWILNILLLITIVIFAVIGQRFFN